MGKHCGRALLASVLGLVVACGGGGDESPTVTRTLPVPPPAPPPGTPATGRFVDSPVQGLSYTCGATSGLTTAVGQFDFLVGNSCSFSIGGVALGSTSGALVATPRELTASAVDETHPTVNNTARLLLSLDGDGDPTNGIVITDGVRTALAGATLNLRATPAVFAAAAQTLLNTVLPGRTLVDAANAGAHLRATLLGLLDGHYNCGYIGTDSGAVTLDISNGVVAGSGRDDESGNTFQVNGALQSSGSATSTTSSGASLTGTFNLSGIGSGTWQDAGGSGVWNCIRA